MDMNVIRVTITAHRIERHHDVGPEGSDVCDNALGDLFNGVRDLGIWVLILWLSGHARIAISEEMYSRQSKLLRCTAQFSFTKLCDRGMSLKVLRIDRASLATRG